MKLNEIAKALNGTVNGAWINIPAPGHSTGDRSLGFKFDAAAPDGIVVKSFSGDDLVECRHYVQGLLHKIADGDLVISPETSASNYVSGQAKLARAMALWEQGSPLTGTIAEIYLGSRGFFPAEFQAIADDLHFHPHCPFSAYRFPAMLGLMRDVITGETVGIHRTALRDDGAGKRAMPDGMNPKMMLGVATRAAVQLQPSAVCLGIAEGIETALSAHIIFGIPVWAVLSSSGIAAFPIIPGVKHLTIFADHDDAGLKAALTCARRYREAGITGEIRYPEFKGSDWNDHLKGVNANE